MMLSIKIIKLLFSFISEIILGKNSFSQVYRHDRKRVYVLIIFMVSLSLNLFIIPRLISISYNLHKTRIEYQLITDRIREYEEKDRNKLKENIED